MANYENHSNTALIATLIGGLLIGASTAYIVSNPKLRRTVYAKYDDFRDKLEDVLSQLNDNTQSIAKGASKQANQWSKKAKHFIEYLRDGVEDWEPERRDMTGLVTGVLGALLAAGVGIMLNSQKKNYPRSMVQKLGSQASSWKKTLDDILECNHDEKGSERKRGRYDKTNAIHDVIDFASSGMQLWQSFKKR